MAMSTDSVRRDSAGIARPTAPDLLIHLHIAKTGGTTLSSMVKHGFGSGQVFETISQEGQTYGGLDLLTYECCARVLEGRDLGRLRYLSGHVPMGVHRIFNRPAKYIAVVRHPVEPVVGLKRPEQALMMRHELGLGQGEAELDRDFAQLLQARDFDGMERHRG